MGTGLQPTCGRMLFGPLESVFFLFSFFSGHQSRELHFLPGPRKSWALHAGEQSAVATSSHVPFLFQLTVLGPWAVGVTTAGWGFVRDQSASPAHCGGEGRGPTSTREGACCGLGPTWAPRPSTHLSTQFL